MPRKTTTAGGVAQTRRDKAEETTRAAKTLIDAERDAAQKKTNRLREERLAREDAEARAAASATPPAKKTRKKAGPAA